MKRGSCKYFNGVQNKVCDAGVNYRELVGGPDAGWCRRMPCHKSDGSSVVCEKRQDPTASEIAEHRAMIDAAMDRMKKVFPLISRVKREHKGTSWKGVEACPVCGGRLHMTHAATNGHVWGQCETSGCVSWME